MDSVSPDDLCIAGNERAVSGAFTFFGKSFGKLTGKNGWQSWLSGPRSQRRHYCHRPHGHGHPA